MRGRTGTRDKYVVAYARRVSRIEVHASRAAARTACSLVFLGRHPFPLSRSTASCIVRTSPVHPRPPPAPPVQAYSTPSRPSSSQIASARARTVMASSLPTLYTENDPGAPRSPARTPVTTSSKRTYGLAVHGRCGREHDPRDRGRATRFQDSMGRDDVLIDRGLRPSTVQADVRVCSKVINDLGPAENRTQVAAEEIAFDERRPRLDGL